MVFLAGFICGMVFLIGLMIAVAWVDEADHKKSMRRKYADSDY